MRKKTHSKMMTGEKIMKIYQWRQKTYDGRYNVVRQFKEAEFSPFCLREYEIEGIEGVLTRSDTSMMSRSRSRIVAVKKANENRIRWA